MSKIIIVSNRLPVSVRKVGDRIEYYPSTGGLATALSSYIKDKNSKWIGWPGITSDELTEEEQKKIAKKLEAYNCYPVFLSKKQLSDFYNGFSNGVLWPIFHNLKPDLKNIEQGWRAYKDVNNLYTDAVLALEGKRNTIWIHDYQLLLMPTLLRKERPHENIGFFLHIPFPAIKELSKLTYAKKLLTGMLGADLIGFHTVSYTTSFLESCEVLQLGVVSEKNIIIENHVARVTDFPISIDYAKYKRVSNSVAVEKAAKKHRIKYGKKKIILTVDRLDPTKGLVERLTAYKQFLKQNPHLHRKVVMVMLAVPSRTEIAEYRELKEQVEALVIDINDRFGELGWLPVDYMFTTMPFEELTALYQVADVAFITPLRDGMNLVAKEYIASHQKKGGVLIISETAGAAEELTNAIIVDPSKKTALVNALNQAITMPKLELTKRITTMQKHLSINTVQKWSGKFLSVLKSSGQLKLNRVQHFSDPIKKLLTNNFTSAHKKLIFLDYDGTLSPFFDNPAHSKPTESLLHLLHALSSQQNTEVIIVSGRHKNDLDDWLGKLPITLIAEHGAFIRPSGKGWHKNDALLLGWKRPIQAAMELYAEKTPGAFVEEKENSLVWHYRKSPPYYAQKNMVILKNLLQQSLRGTGLRVFTGNKILEVKSEHVNKGAAIKDFLSKDTDFIMAIGDDYTDEDMFMNLPSHAFTIKVGTGRTQARFRIRTVEDVHKLLKRLTN